MHREEMVISGAGLATCLGLSVEQTWSAVRRGACGIRPLEHVESPLSPNKGGGEAPPLPAGAGSGRSAPREVTYLRWAMNEALGQAGVSAELAGAVRVGVVLGTTLHGMRSGGAFLRSNNFDHLGHFLAGGTLLEAAAGIPWLGPLHTAITTCSACSSGLASVGLACTLLRDGAIDLALAGGYDPISEYAYAGFNSMRLVSGSSLRPFQRDRDGMKVAEGYGVVVLERAKQAASRGVEPLAVIGGVAESCDCFHLSKPHPEGRGAAEAMREALRQAESSGDPESRAESLHLISAHATATRDNDAAEYAAMRGALGSALSDVPVVGFKSHLGHTLGAAGCVELILAVRSMKDGTVPPCANVADDGCEFEGLRVASGQGERRKGRAVLVTSLGFGGANACCVARAAVEGANAQGIDSRPPPAQEPLITGIGIIVPGGVGNQAFRSLIRGTPPAWPDGEVPAFSDELLAEFVQARRVRRMSDFSKLCIAAAGAALSDAGVDELETFGEEAAVLVGTMHGAAGFCEAYYRQLINEGVDAANPLLFAEGVPNVGSAHVSTTYHLRRGAQSIIGSRTAGLDALRLAAARVRTGELSRVLVVAAEELTPLVREAYSHFGLHPNGEETSNALPPGWGAVGTLVESRASAERRGAGGYGAVGPAVSAARGGGSLKAWVRAAAGSVSGLPPAQVTVGSANRTWVDRFERAVVRGGWGRREAADMRLHVPEMMSVLPLARLAAELLGGEVPDRGAAERGSPSTATHLTVTATDYAGAFTALSIRRLSDGR